MSTKAGERADYLGPDGYMYVDIDGIAYRAERVAWMYIYGEDREDIIHIDGDHTNNRLSNLRPAGIN